MTSLLRRSKRALFIALNLARAQHFGGGWAATLSMLGRLLSRKGPTATLVWLLQAIGASLSRDDRFYRLWLRGNESPPEPLPTSEAGPPGCAAVAFAMGLSADPARRLLGALDRELHPRAPIFAILASETLKQLQGSAALLALPRIRLLDAARGPLHAVLDQALADARVTSVLFVHDSMPRRAQVARLAAELDPPCALVYGDEDALDERGRRCRPYFKPGYSRDLLEVHDYLSACMLADRDLVASALADLGTRLHGPHDLALALAHGAARVRHIPRVVSHRLAGAARLPAAQPPGVLAELLRLRYGDGAGMEPSGVVAPRWRPRYGTAGPTTRVSVIIPTRDRLDLLEPCVESLYRRNRGQALEVIILDNDSEEPETREYLARAPSRYAGLRVLDAPYPFNWSRLNNQGIRAARGDVLLFLNNDTEAIGDGALQRLAEQALRPSVGAAGPMLLYPGGRIQHAGVVVGIGGIADHIYQGARPEDTHAPFVPPALPREVSAVTGACMCVSRRVVDAVGGFDEGYRVTGSDVEYCLRLLDKGYRILYDPTVRLIHKESQTRFRNNPAEDTERLRALVQGRLTAGDRYYNPNLSLEVQYPALTGFPETWWGGS